MYGWVKTLVIYLIVSKLVIQIIPGATYKKYIHFLTGLIIVLVLIEPVTALLHFDIYKIDMSLDYMSDFCDENVLGDSIYDYYELGIKTSIEQELRKMDFTDCKCEIIKDKDENISVCRLFFEQVLSDEQISIIKKHIMDVYNIDSESIYIISR